MDNFKVNLNKFRTSFVHLWTIFEWYLDNFCPILRTFWTVFRHFVQVQSLFFFLRGEIPGYRHTQVAEKYIGTLLTKGESNTSTTIQWCKRHIGITLTVKADKGYGHTQSLYGGHARPRQTWQAYRPWRPSRDPHPVGRDPHPLGHQPGHQGEWALVKETSRTQGLQPVCQGCMVITKSNTVLTA